MQIDHYAILLAINYYPGLRNLGGPENDVAAFRTWLVDNHGGDVDPKNIEVIRSSDYSPPASNPNDANPTERAFIRVLDKWARETIVDAHGLRSFPWKDEKIGRRLYMYMAGHGFTAGSSIVDPALFSAVAQNGDTAHIAGFRYASKIANAGFFDEIVLIMDCCQDVLKASQVLEPTWSPPDKQASANVKLLQAYGAPRGEAAFEAEVSPGVKRGYFSSVLMEALSAALPDSTGFVTGTTLKDQFQQIWTDRYKSLTGYVPPIILPATFDIQLFARVRAVIPSMAVQPVFFSLATPAEPNAILDVAASGGSTVHSMPASKLSPYPLAPGIYKASLRGTSRGKLFEVTGSANEPVTL